MSYNFCFNLLCLERGILNFFQHTTKETEKIGISAPLPNEILQQGLIKGNMCSSFTKPERVVREFINPSFKGKTSL